MIEGVAGALPTSSRIAKRELTHLVSEYVCLDPLSAVSLRIHKATQLTDPAYFPCVRLKAVRSQPSSSRLITIIIVTQTIVTLELRVGQMSLLAIATSQVCTDQESRKPRPQAYSKYRKQN